MILYKSFDFLRTMADELSDQLKAKQAKGLTTPLLQQQRDGLHRLSVHGSVE
jgi:hypothetical protein